MKEVAILPEEAQALLEGINLLVKNIGTATQSKGLLKVAITVSDKIEAAFEEPKETDD